MVSEQIHRYPRWLRWPIDLVCGLLVLLAALLLGRDLLRFGWFLFGLDTSLFRAVPFLSEIVQLVRGNINQTPTDELSHLLPSLIWLLLALLLALLLPNSFPTIRTSPRGMLVEFANGWLPVPWETLKAIKVTEDLGAERFVLLAEADGSRLTGWHRLYSLLYNFRIKRGFLINSAISNFDGLVKTLLDETDRVAKVLDNVKPARIQEGSSSPLFGFMLGPASFFSHRSPTEVQASAGMAVNTGGPLRGAYPQRISGLLTWGALVLLVLVLVRYLISWLEFIALLQPRLLALPVFNRLTLSQAQQAAPWWLLVAAHLMVLIFLGLLVALRNLLPDLEARAEGLAVRYFNRWVVVPWQRISAIKVTEFSENSQILLLQANSGLPASARFSSLLYDGSLTPGVLITSALSSFEPLMQRVVLEVTRNQPQANPDESPILQSDARSPLLMLSFRAAQGIDLLIEESREDPSSSEIQPGRLLRTAGPMAALALMPALLAFAERAIHQGLLPTPGLFVGMLVLFLLGLLEWPLVSLAAVMLDELTGGGEEGNRPFYLYPLIQLPRLLPLTGALICTLLGLPALPVLFWLGAIGWSFVLSAGLWSALYDWRGGQLLAGGLVPVAFQMFILLAYLLVLR